MRRWVVLGAAAVAATGVALGAGASASAAPSDEGTIRAAGAGVVAPNSYIVVFKDAAMKASSVDLTVNTLSTKFGGNVSHKFHSALRGFSVKDLSEAQAKKLAADPAVAYVQQDMIMKVKTTQTTPYWNLDRIDQRSLPLDGSYSYPTTASNVHAYVIDTGIRITHQEFGGRATYGYNYVDDNFNADDCNGHGTHVAGTLGGATTGVAKGVQLVAVKVLDCSGSGLASSIAAAVDDTIANAVKPAVINMSLGATGSYPPLEQAVQRAVAAGITVAVAAGNGDNNNGIPIDACNTTPARVPEALTVAATDQADQRASYSNYGSCVDLFAPGDNVTSAFYTADNAYAVGSGTSMATPNVAGAAALILGTHPSLAPGQVRDALVTSATSGVVGNPGAGSPNLLLYTVPPVIAGKTVVLYNPRFGTTEVYARTPENHIVYAYWSGYWSAWMDLGGNAAGDPAVIYNPRFGTTEVYVRTTDNRLAYRYWNNGWSNWNDLQGNLAGNPSVIYNPRFGTTEAYVRTAGNTLAYRYWNNGWSDWNDLQGDVASDPAVLYNPRFGTTEAYVRNGTGKLQYRYWNNGWAGWIDLDGSAVGNPAVLYNPRFGTTEVYTRTAGNTLAYRYYSSGWSGWNDLGGSLASDPALLFNPRFGTTEAYVQTADNKLAYRYYSNGWSDWNDLGGSLGAGPRLIYNPRFGTTEVYARTSDSKANYRYFSNAWSDWIDVVL